MFLLPPRVSSLTYYQINTIGPVSLNLSSFTFFFFFFLISASEAPHRWGRGKMGVVEKPKLQALVYDILPSTTAVFSYAIGSTKLSANEKFCCCAQTVVSLLQTTQIKQDVSFIAANKVYTSTKKNHDRLNRDGTLFYIFYPGWMRLMFTCVLWR